MDNFITNKLIIEVDKSCYWFKSISSIQIFTVTPADKSDPTFYRMCVNSPGGFTITSFSNMDDIYSKLKQYIMNPIHNTYVKINHIGLPRYSRSFDLIYDNVEIQIVSCAV